MNDEFNDEGEDSEPDNLYREVPMSQEDIIAAQERRKEKEIRLTEAQDGEILAKFNQKLEKEDLDTIITDPLLKKVALSISKSDVEGPKDSNNDQAMLISEMNTDYLRLRVNFYQNKLAQSQFDLT